MGLLLLDYKHNLRANLRFPTRSFIALESDAVNTDRSSQLFKSVIPANLGETRNLLAANPEITEKTKNPPQPRWISALNSKQIQLRLWL
ncbi:hypothetical protein BK412_10810 [Vibrio campbellii]|nr:hypothetical protein BK412_10810 [Vibrio campbellii]